MKSLVNTEIRGFKIIDHKRENNKTYVKVICPYCRSEKWMRLDTIHNEKVISCGCYNKDNNYLKPMDLTGKVFGKLTVKNPTGKKDRYGCVIWSCVCECGKIKNIAGSVLVRGRVTSCGCYGDRVRSKNGKKVGKFIVDNFCVENTQLNNLRALKPKNNSSGFKGVTWDTSRCKWAVQIGFQKKNYHLGRFDRLDEAVAVRKAAEEKLFKPILDKYNKTEEGKDGI